MKRRKIIQSTPKLGRTLKTHTLKKQSPTLFSSFSTFFFEGGGGGQFSKETKDYKSGDNTSSQVLEPYHKPIRLALSERGLFLKGTRRTAHAAHELPEQILTWIFVSLKTSHTGIVS